MSAEYRVQSVVQTLTSISGLWYLVIVEIDVNCGVVDLSRKVQVVIRGVFIYNSILRQRLLHVQFFSQPFPKIFVGISALPKGALVEAQMVSHTCRATVMDGDEAEVIIEPPTYEEG